MRYKYAVKLVILICLLFGLPMLGAVLSGRSIGKYLEFPPAAKYAEHAPFSWTAFIIFASLISAAVLPLLIITVRSLREFHLKPERIHKMPWWGKAGILSMALFWVIAWGRFDSIIGFQEYIFPMLWLSYIIVVNSLHYQETGKCIMTAQTGRFLLLFPASAVFWWYFEYLNSFVQNWYYIAADYDQLKLFLLSTLSFSTVLPAVISTGNLLLSCDWITKGFKRIWTVRNPVPGLTAFLALVISCSGLIAAGMFPDYFFSLVWLSPLLIIVSLQTLFNERHILSDIADGNWSLVVSASLAALICGLFWEMWNFYSLPKWQYSIPLVQRFHIFEMPVLGYAGYLPFGLLCMSIGDMMGINIFDTD